MSPDVPKGFLATGSAKDAEAKASTTVRQRTVDGNAAGDIGGIGKRCAITCRS